MATKNSRKATRAASYSPVLKLPPLPYEQFVALRDSIALNGVLVPIIVDSEGPKRKIIDGNYRKAIAVELGYDCPEMVQANLDDGEKRTLARCLNLARRQLTQEQRRELIADQLEESPGRSNRVDFQGARGSSCDGGRCTGGIGVNWTDYPVGADDGAGRKSPPNIQGDHSSVGT